jgi:predicted ATPase
MESDHSPTFGAVLRAMRLAKKLTQEGLAERARLSVDAISTLERGSRKAPYAHTLRLLVQALELDPTAEERLRAAAARSAPAADRIASGSPAEPDAARPAFPQRLTRFIGRDADLGALADMIARNRLTTITGVGGVGKTRIAIEVGTALGKTYRDGARFVELAPLREAGLLAQEIAAALQLREAPGQAVIDNIVGALRERRLLLVIDNCEHLIVEAARVVETLLLRCPQITVVATSREALRVDGERVYRLATFSVPPAGASVSPATALQHSSVALFVERARAVDAGFAFNAGNVDDIVRICRRVDGVPLALEIVAAQTTVMEPAQIAGRLQQRFLLGEGTRTAEPRQRTLRSLLAWSVDLLSAAERVVFSRLAVFAGPWTVDAAESVCAGDPIDGESMLGHLHALVAKSLVSAENDRDGRRRFRLLEMTRDYAHELLAKREEFDAVTQRHTMFILGFARAAGTAGAAAPDLTWLEMVEHEIENVRSVLEWSLAQRHAVAAGAEIAAALGPYWDYRSYEEGTRWLELARGALDALEPQLAARVRLESVRIAPFTSEAYPLVERALETFRASGDGPGMFAALELVGKTLINLGRYRDAFDALTEAIELAQRAGDTASIARLTATLAFARLYLGDHDAALRDLNEASVFMSESGRARDLALIDRGLAEAAIVRNDVDGALDLAPRVLGVLERLGDQREIAAAHYLIAQAWLAADRVDEAAAEVSTALAALLGAQIPLSFLEASIVAAAVLVRKGEDRRAARLIGYVQRHLATFPFRPTPLIAGLLDAALAALTTRMDGDDLRFGIAAGRLFDDERVVAESCERVPAGRR